MNIDEFYANINHQFSLIVNKIKTEDYNQDTINVLVEMYRNRALDVFIRGLNGELSKMLMIQRPQTLPEAYSFCLEMQNLNFRTMTIQKRNFNNSVTVPVNQMTNVRNGNHFGRRTTQLPPQQRNLAYNIQHQHNNRPPPRPTQPKPPVPMDIDQSIQTRQVNYINRNHQSNFAIKRENNLDGHAQKQQRLNHMVTQAEAEIQRYEDYMQQSSDAEEYEEDQEQTEEESEINFMTGACLAYHT